MIHWHPSHKIVPPSKDATGLKLSLGSTCIWCLTLGSDKAAVLPCPATYKTEIGVYAGLLYPSGLEVGWKGYKRVMLYERGGYPNFGPWPDSLYAPLSSEMLVAVYTSLDSRQRVMILPLQDACVDRAANVIYLSKVLGLVNAHQEARKKIDAMLRARTA